LHGWENVRAVHSVVKRRKYMSPFEIYDYENGLWLPADWEDLTVNEDDEPDEPEEEEDCEPFDGDYEDYYEDGLL
jgi:hypothetical protein